MSRSLQTVRERHIKFVGTRETHGLGYPTKRPGDERWVEPETRMEPEATVTGPARVSGRALAFFLGGH